MLLEVKEGIRITIYNKATVLGCYYIEDDWKIQSIGKTYESALNKIVVKFIQSKIVPSNWTVERVSYVIYKNRVVVLEGLEISCLAKYSRDLIHEIKSHPLFEKYTLKRNKIEQRKEAEEKRREEEKVKARELKLLKKLKQKYESK